MMSADEAKSIVIVGGGPVGLAYAWGLKKVNPDLHVVVVERFEEYQRKHTLIMQPNQLQALMQATGTEQDPILSKLLKELKKDGHIRTTELEQRFKQVALDAGVQFKIAKIEEETYHAQIQEAAGNKTPLMTIGADGTHSVTSQVLFGPDNQVKHEFDFVLQCRFEMPGDLQAPRTGTLHMLQVMASHGFIANEYVGKYDENTKTTPVTMQMMISKEDYMNLQAHMKAKEPANPFKTLDEIRAQEDADEDGIAIPKAELPDPIQKFITAYLKTRTQFQRDKPGVIDHNKIKISVNEAPATHSKKIFTQTDNCGIAVLRGDANLGLSYFKGLNAGIEAAARFFKTMRPALLSTDSVELVKGLEEHQEWFLNEFAPSKVKEVADYSRKQIRRPEKIIRGAHRFKGLSFFDPEGDETLALRNYFDEVKKIAEYAARGAQQSRQPVQKFPHRKYDPVKFGRFKMVPPRHTLDRIGKIFGDFFKPYKGRDQLFNDFKQPLRGIAHFFIGFGKIFTGIGQRKGALIGDGFLTLLRSAVEIATTPLVYVVKPITRGIATLIKRPTAIEEYSSMKKLADQGLAIMKNVSEQDPFVNHAYELRALAADLHRKFDKAMQKGRRTHMAMDEKTAFHNVDTTAFHAGDENTKTELAYLQNYFGLFSSRKFTAAEQQPVNAELNDAERQTRAPSE